MNTRKITLISLVAVFVMAFAGLASAQEPMPPQVERQPGARLQEVAELVAEATGLTVEEIRAQLAEGATLADIVTAAGGDVDALIAEIVEALIVTEAEQRERLTTAVTNLFNGELEGPGLRDRFGREGGLRDRFGDGRLMDAGRQILGVVVEETGLEPRELMSTLRSEDTTLADVISENGGDVEAIVAAVLEPVNERLATAVSEGRVEQEQADELAATFEETVRAIISGEMEWERRLPMRPDRPGFGNRG